MNDILIKIGLCSTVILVLYIIKKADDYLYFKKERNTCYKFEEDDDG